MFIKLPFLNIKPCLMGLYLLRLYLLVHQHLAMVLQGLNHQARSAYTDLHPLGAHSALVDPCLREALRAQPDHHLREARSAQPDLLLRETLNAHYLLLAPRDHNLPLRFSRLSVCFAKQMTTRTFPVRS